jgi:hypothetical protein
VVNGETGSVGDPTKIKEQFDKVRLRIAPVPGNNSYGSPICGEVRATPTPEATQAPPSPGGGGPSPSSEAPKPSVPPPSNCKPNKPCQTTPATPAPGLALPAALLAVDTWRRWRLRRRAA